MTPAQTQTAFTRPYPESPSSHANVNSDHGEYNSNNISQYRICAGEYIHVDSDTYVLCIPRVGCETTKMDVARAVEQCILQIGGDSENFKYVKKVIFIRAFDEIVFNNTLKWNSDTQQPEGSGSSPWYKIAMVQIDIPRGYDEYGVEIYTDYEEKFYGSVCRGDLVVGTWADAFFVANPKKYFRPQHQQEDQHKQQAKNEVCEYQESAFQKWKYDFKLKQLERKVKEQENTIRQFEMDASHYQNTINEYAESIRFLTRQKVDSCDLDGLNCMSNGLSNYLSVLSNRYSRVCISDTSFLEINKNMKLKKMHGLVINMCDDGDACQELIHSIDFIDAAEHPELFFKIQKLICRINHSVQQFEKLHLHAERSLFGLRNRKVFEGFSLFLNTALEIVEEVTSRCSAYTQDLEYAMCYGQLNSGLPQYGQQEEQQQCEEERAEFATSAGTVYGYGYDYDYSECADPLNHDDEVESTHQMLSYFDQKQQQLYHQQKCQQEQQQQEQQQEQQPQEEDKSETVGLNLDSGVDSGVVVYYEEDVVIEGEGVKIEAETTSAITSTTASSEQDKKKGGWLSSWF